MIVKNKTLRLIVVSSSVTLIPGINDVELSASDIAAIKDHAGLELVEVKIEDPSAQGISAMNAPQAIAIINDTNDEDAVRSLLEEEQNGKKRASVIKAIEAKLEEIKSILDASKVSSDNKEDGESEEF